MAWSLEHGRRSTCLYFACLPVWCREWKALIMNGEAWYEWGWVPGIYSVIRLRCSMATASVPFGERWRVFKSIRAVRKRERVVFKTQRWRAHKQVGDIHLKNELTKCLINSIPISWRHTLLRITRATSDTLLLFLS
jgi:hypothetical protein